MLSPQHQTNLLKAKGYFEQPSPWATTAARSRRFTVNGLGAGARLLGLSGVVQRDEFVASVKIAILAQETN
jgi:hypothetical protein